jgi:hypothetical protein
MDYQDMYAKHAWTNRQVSSLTFHSPCPLLYSLFTHDCVAKHDSNTIKFADDTTVVGLITDNDETANREVRELAVWCQDNFSLNVSKTKELIVDYRKRRAEQAPI